MKNVLRSLPSRITYAWSLALNFVERGRRIFQRKLGHGQPDQFGRFLQTTKDYVSLRLLPRNVTKKKNRKRKTKTQLPNCHASGVIACQLSTPAYFDWFLHLCEARTSTFKSNSNRNPVDTCTFLRRNCLSQQLFLFSLPHFWLIIQHHFSQCGCNVPVKTKDLSNELFGECQFYCDRVWNNQNYYSIRSASAHLLTQFSVSQQKLSKFLYVAVVVNVKLSGFWQTDVDTSILSRRQLKLSCTNSP